jgi:hypothetical protein
MVVVYDIDHTTKDPRSWGERFWRSVSTTSAVPFVCFGMILSWSAFRMSWFTSSADRQLTNPTQG